MRHKVIRAKNLKFELEEKSDHQSMVKFHGESNGDSLVNLKRRLDTEMGHKGQMRGQKSPNSKIKLKKSYTATSG